MCGADLSPILDKYINIQAVKRSGITYDLSDPDTVRWANNQVSTNTLRALLGPFLTEILGSHGAFVSPTGNRIADTLGLVGIKAAAGQKDDITVVAIDPKTQVSTEASFSIKSNLGEPSTLLNASRATNVRFKVDGYTGNAAAINAIDSRSKLRDRINEIYSKNGRFVNPLWLRGTFNRNLMKVDGVLPDILAYLTLGSHISDSKNISRVMESEFFLERITHLPVQLDTDLIKYKLKAFLLDIALGMMPATEWEGRHRADGGYIVVKDDGDIVCFHTFNFYEFSEYLFNSTKFDTPSSTRHGFGSLIDDGDGQYFDLNCQIRFI